MKTQPIQELMVAATPNFSMISKSWMNKFLFSLIPARLAAKNEKYQEQNTIVIIG